MATPVVEPERRRKNSVAARPKLMAARTKIEQLLCINGISPPPPAPPSNLSEDTKRDIRSIYSSAYAPGMDKFLETRWFSERGLHHLTTNSVLCDQFALLVHRYAMNPLDPAYYIHYGITQSLEAMVVWAMLTMCRQIATASPIPDEELREGVVEAAHRLRIFEILVTGEYLGSSPASMPIKTDSSDGQPKSREQEFWSAVELFVSLREEGNAAAIDEALSQCRGLLERRENRDVIYSIMVVRHVGAQIPNFPNMAPPETNDERDAHARVAVAKKLLDDEAAGKGTNQVVQRLCGVAARTWSLRR